MLGLAVLEMVRDSLLAPVAWGLPPCCRCCLACSIICHPAAGARCLAAWLLNCPAAWLTVGVLWLVSSLFNGSRAHIQVKQLTVNRWGGDLLLVPIVVASMVDKTYVQTRIAIPHSLRRLILPHSLTSPSTHQGSLMALQSTQLKASTDSRS